MWVLRSKGFLAGPLVSRSSTQATGKANLSAPPAFAAIVSFCSFPGLKEKEIMTIQEQGGVVSCRGWSQPAGLWLQVS